jgi:protein-disulfide isomerase
MNDEQNNLSLKERRDLKHQEKLERRESRDKAASRETIQRALLWLFVVIILGLAIFAMVKLVNAPASTTKGITADVLSSISPKDDWIRDNAQASTTITEFADFQCPACKAFETILTQVHKQYGNNIRFVYKYFPLGQHINAVPAAQAAEAAGRQGAFWQMHDMLYANQTTWEASTDPESIFVGYAGKLGLNITQFKKDFSDPAVAKKISADYDLGISFGVNATPTFFVDNNMLQFNTVQEFYDAIQAGIIGDGGTIASTTNATSTKQ